MGKAPGNSWARPRAVTESATEKRPPQRIVVRVKWWGKSPPRFPATETARQTPPEQGQIGGEENAHSDKDAAGRLHEGGGDFAPRGMTATELRLRYRTRLTGCSVTTLRVERSWALLRQRCPQSTRRSGITRQTYLPGPAQLSGKTVAARSAVLNVKRTSSVGM
jgi:hypothetical protein